MSREQEERSLSTADFVAAADAPAQRAERMNDTTVADARVSDVHEAREMRDVRDPDDMREARDVRDVRGPATQAQGEPLAALFTPEIAGDFQSRWDAVQIGFVDDPREAVRRADELVAQVMKSLAESFANERERIESQLDPSDSEATEHMRVALRRYRSFFQRLLSL